GIFGGTFDPPHLGHIKLAHAARDQLKLDRVLWVVAGQSPLKLDRALSPAETRVEMAQAAIAGEPSFVLSRVDLDRPGPHYTVDTLKILTGETPGAELFFIMGEDSLRDLPRWRNPGEIIELARLAVCRRPGVSANLENLESIIPGLSDRIVWISFVPLEIASSDIQRQRRGGGAVESLLPAGVLEVIERAGLYL
ncbi:MAG: nicotinate-nucleotide adenylyltransferase, partial [Chloroflexota bacterium]